jgi:putative ABC transport system substrate-binding protein
LDELAAELVRLPVDVIVAGRATGPLNAAVRATTSIPIVMMGTLTGDPVALGRAESLARPGGNVTGVMRPPWDLDLKRLQLLREAAPGVGKVLLLLSPGPLPERWETDVASLGIAYVEMRPEAREAFEPAFARAVAEGADGLVLLPSTWYANNAALIIELAERYRLPATYASRGFVERGGLMMYEPRFAEIQRSTADYVDRILRGARPGDLPIQLPTRYELVVDLRAARRIGLTLPPAFLDQADEIIE